MMLRNFPPGKLRVPDLAAPFGRGANQRRGLLPILPLLEIFELGFVTATRLASPGADIARRMKRIAVPTGVLSRTINCVAVSAIVTVFGGPETQVEPSPDTCTT